MVQTGNGGNNLYGKSVPIFYYLYWIYFCKYCNNYYTNFLLGGENSEID